MNVCIDTKDRKGTTWPTTQTKESKNGWKRCSPRTWKSLSSTKWWRQSKVWAASSFMLTMHHIHQSAVKTKRLIKQDKSSDRKRISFWIYCSLEVHNGIRNQSYTSIEIDIRRKRSVERSFIFSRRIITRWAPLMACFRVKIIWFLSRRES